MDAMEAILTRMDRIACRSFLPSTILPELDLWTAPDVSLPYEPEYSGGGYL